MLQMLKIVKNFYKICFNNRYRTVIICLSCGPAILWESRFQKGAKYCPTNAKHELLTALASDRVSQI